MIDGPLLYFPVFLLIGMEAEIALPNPRVLINQRRFDIKQKRNFPNIYSNVRD